MPDIRECVRLILEDEGYSVVTASNGAEAEQELAHMEDPCVVLLDLMMPVMNGWELLDHLERDGKLDDGIHVVVVSATATHGPAALDHLHPQADARRSAHRDGASLLLNAAAIS